MFEENKSGVMLNKTYNEYWSILKAYYRLSIQPEMTEQDADELDQILQQAEFDASLNFVLSEIDYIISLKFGLRNEVFVKSYRDQKAWLREHLETLDPGQIEYHRELQKLLQEGGFYDGPVDGVAGKDFHQAVIRFQHSRDLEEDGLVGLKTLTKLTPDTETLLKFMPDAEKVIRVARLERCLEADTETPPTTTEEPYVPAFGQNTATD
jgi:hypothetical protein